MNNKIIRLFRLIYGIALSAMSVISGLLLMAACLQIYHSGGEQIYTPEKVAAAFAPIALPIFITLALIAGSFLLAFLLPVEKPRVMQKQYPLLLRIAYARADMQLCNGEIQGKIVKEQRRRRLVLLISLVAWVIGAAILIPYACNGSNYSEELHLATDSILGVIWWLIPCSLIPTAFSVFSAYYCRASIRRELELVKQVPKTAAPLPRENKTNCKILYARLAILTIALVMLIGGFLAGGTVDVLAKAVAICTECVGLG